MPAPLVPGHEAAGVVLEVGSAVTYRSVGDTVAVFGASRGARASAISRQ